MTEPEKNALLLERLIRFSEKVILLCKRLPETLVNRRLIPQVVASSDSMASNYGEACEAESGLDFIHKISVDKKEARETRVHLRLLYAANPGFRGHITGLGKECVEYIKIFSSIDKSYRNKVRSRKSVKSANV